MAANIQEAFKTFSSQSVAWQPDSSLIEQANVERFLKKYQIDSLEDLSVKAGAEPEWFYESVLEELNIDWISKYSRILKTDQGNAFPKWFTGGKTNLLHYTIEKQLREGNGSRSAIVWEGENGETASYTYKQLNDEVNALALGLLELGIKKGDRVGIYLPPIPEAPIAMFACAKIGAIIIPIFSGYGADAAAVRLKDGEANLLITADGYYRRGKTVDMKSEADQAVIQASSVQHVLVVDRLKQLIHWHEDKDIHYRKLVDKYAGRKVETAVLEADDPFMIMYTSGTTGKPKGTVHTHTGFPIKAALDQYFCFDFKQEDKVFWFTDFGWMMGPWLFLGTALHGCEAILYEGSPDYPHRNRLWELIQQHQVSIFGISPTLIRSFMTADAEVPPLPSLRILGSTGEPWNAEAWQWFLERVGKSRCPIINYSGGTEVSGGILGTFPTKPIKPCSFNGPIPGMAAQIVNEQGEAVELQIGDLTLAKPFLGMTKSFWRDDSRYLDAYWAKWDGVWAHGDFAAVDADGFWYLLGRSDDTIKVAGKRIGPSEIESAVISHSTVCEAAAIGVPHDIKGTVPVVFAVLHEGAVTAETELRDHAAHALGKALSPQAVHIVSELPYTQSGKVARRVIKAAYLQDNPGDISTIKNAAVLQEIAAKGESS